MVLPKHPITVVSGRSMFYSLLNIPTKVPALGLLIESFTQISMKEVVQSALMLLIKLGVLCLVCRCNILSSHISVDLVNIFESFLPQLLRYPNPADPLNGEAAALHMDNIEKYNSRVRDHVAKHASRDIRLTEDDDRKISSESSTTVATDRPSDCNNDAKAISNGANDDDDVDDGASDVSNMSDL